MTSPRRLNRRAVLRGLGTALALPWLDAMLPARSLLRAATTAAAPPKRLAFFFVPNGVHLPDWTPAEEGRNFKLPKILEPLAPFKQDLLVYSGLSQYQGTSLGDGAGDHARSAATFLTGVHPRKTGGANIKAGISADQVAAQKIGYQTLYPSLELGCEPSRQAGNCDSGYSCAYSSTISWKTESMPLAKETQPRLLFERLFGGGDSNERAAARVQRDKYRRSILDYALDDAARLQQRLGATDRQKLDQYLSAVREIEQRIEHAERLASAAPPRLEVGRIDDYDFSSFAEQVRLMGDLLVLAFQADLTRVATFMLANEGSNRSYAEIGVKEGHHTLSHHQNDAEKQAKISQINRFHMEQFAYIVGKLAEAREGEARLLDSSMILYGSGLGDGNRHTHVDLPILTVGRGGGTLATGRHVVYESKTPLNNLFLSLLDRMGAGVEALGDSTGRLAKLDG